VQVHYDEGLANDIGPEPCGGLREETDEKSVGARVGAVSRRESGFIQSADTGSRTSWLRILFRDFPSCRLSDDNQPVMG